MITWNHLERDKEWFREGEITWDHLDRDRERGHLERQRERERGHLERDRESRLEREKEVTWRGTGRVG